MKPAFTALADVLAQMCEVVRQLSDADYCAPGPKGVSGSVGQHVRHCLDHVVALEEGLRTRRINYDIRLRGRAIESERRLAIAALETTCNRLRSLDDRWLPAFVEVTSLLSAEGRTVSANSTIGRELVFVMSHTIHHNATINVLLQQRQVATPARFGFAVSTPCALSA